MPFELDKINIVALNVLNLGTYNRNNPSYICHLFEYEKTGVVFKIYANGKLYYRNSRWVPNGHWTKQDFKWLYHYITYVEKL